jgi:hypothetical protein
MISKNQFDTEIQNIVKQLINLYKPEELEQRLKLGDPFIKNIIDEGTILYDAA